MFHARQDYQHIQDPEGRIGEDEPVMLFRSRDALAPEVLRYYAKLIRQKMDDPRLATEVEKHAARMEAWQEVNGKKFPDVYEHHYVTEEPVFRAPESSESPPLRETVPGHHVDEGQSEVPPASGDMDVVQRPAGEERTPEPVGLRTFEAEGSETGRVEDTHNVTEAEKPVVQDDVTQTPAGGENDEPDGPPAGEATDGEKTPGEPGPLSEGGERLMGGQPSEHQPGTPDETPDDDQ